MAWSRSKRWEVERAGRPWGDRPSIHAFLTETLCVAIPPRTPPPLPDEDRVSHGEARWAVGARDGVATHHVSNPEDEPAAREVWAALLAVVSDASDAAVARLYDLACLHRAASVADPLCSLAQAEKVSERARAARVGRFLSQGAADREPVKVGIVLVGLFGDDGDWRSLRLLARHDEFTLFAIVALANLGLGGEKTLWDVAQDVHGWGRVHAVERLSQAQDPRVNRWLVRDGFRNDVMDEYLALICAEAGDLAGALAEETVDDGLLEGAAGILSALLHTTCNGPARGFEAYGQGVPAVRRFLRLAARGAGSLDVLLAAGALRRFAEDGEVPWDALAGNGWTREVRSEIAASSRAIVERPEWVERVRAAVASEDQRTSLLGSAAADAIGTDVWELQFERLRDTCREADPCWWHVCRTDDPSRMDRVIAFAEEAIPLERIATGPAKDAGFGPERLPHRSLGWVLPSLARFPGRGWPLLRAGLRSPVVGNRLAAASALAAWDRAAWPSDAAALLDAALRDEPDPDVRDRLLRLHVGGPTS